MAKAKKKVFVGWKINRSKPVSIDYINPSIGYSKQYSYQVVLDNLRTEEQLKHWLEHLSEKSWFASGGFIAAREQALKEGL